MDFLGWEQILVFEIVCYLSLPKQKKTACVYGVKSSFPCYALKDKKNLVINYFFNNPNIVLFKASGDDM